MTGITDPQPIDLETVRSLRDIFLALPLDRADTGTAMFDLHARVKSLGSRCRELSAMIEDAALEHIETTGHDIDLPDGTRWYSAQSKTVKAKSDSAVLMAVMDAVGGDHTRIASGENGVLAANPWKIGALKGILGAERVEELFATTYGRDLKTGAPVKKLAQSNPMVDAAKKAIATKGGAA